MDGADRRRHRSSAAVRLFVSKAGPMQPLQQGGGHQCLFSPIPDGLADGNFMFVRGRSVMNAREAPGGHDPTFCPSIFPFRQDDGGSGGTLFGHEMLPDKLRYCDQRTRGEPVVQRSKGPRGGL